ncbi:MAG: hypothetical protein ACHQ1D_01240 [Nitrososphaerales archaeon]
MSDLKGLDAWITSGRYRFEYLLVECSKCKENSVVMAEQDYGSVWWTPDECKFCGTLFDDNCIYEEYYPEEERDA